MATMRTLLYTHPEIHSDPGNALSQLSQIFHSLIGSDLFMTALFLLLHPQGRIDCAVAGQYPPVRLSKAGVAPVHQAAAGLPLGISPNVRYQTVAYEMLPGERLVVFTDGIFEATNRQGKQWGITGITQGLQKLSQEPLAAEALLDAVVEDVKAHMDGLDFEDDFTLLAIERKSL
jgi:sigma-B regulation protein RsbU (phosphoserine phosphatase)